MSTNNFHLTLHKTNPYRSGVSFCVHKHSAVNEHSYKLSQCVYAENLLYFIVSYTKFFMAQKLWLRRLRHRPYVNNNEVGFLFVFQYICSAFVLKNVYIACRWFKGETLSALTICCVYTGKYYCDAAVSFQCSIPYRKLLQDTFTVQIEMNMFEPDRIIVGSFSFQKNQTYM